MSRVSPAQMKKLLDLLSVDGVLFHGRVLYTNTNKQSFWKRIANQLNSVEGGVYKNTWKWCKMWADWKNKTKKKANILLRRKSYNFEQPPPTLTNLELRLLKLIDYPLDEKIETLQLLKNVDKIEAPESVDENEDYVNHDISNMVVEDNHSQVGYINSADTKFCNVDNISIGDLQDNLEESSDLERKTKKGKSNKKKKITLQEYNIKTTIALEKERSHQKTEELRLKAIELKLKGEELRLKEMEMNKINYLTNVEEEKLKCFREISASLKELVECSRSGNIRFHNVL